MGKEGAEVSWIGFLGGLGGRGCSFGMELGSGIHSQRLPSVAGRLKLQPPACLAAAGRFLHGRPPRVPMGAGVLCCLGGSMDALGACEVARALGCLRRKNRKTLPPCSRSPQHPGFQRPIRRRTPVVSATALCPPGPWPPLCWSQPSSSSAAVSVSTGSDVGGGWARRARPKPRSTFRK